jgi:hypothetical protein
VGASARSLSFTVRHLFLLIRFSPLDIKVIPGAGGIMLIALAVAFLAPIASA